MEFITCETCGCQNDSHTRFCRKCGRFLFQKNFEDQAASADAELKLARIVHNLEENPHTDILWNDTIDAFARKIERIQSLLRVKDVGIESEELNQKVDKFLNLCRKPDFEIAFVGAVKAGKSTLINALLGRNYASTDPNPETAVLTKFRSSEQDYVHVRFYSAKEWERLWRSVQKDAEKFLELYHELGAEKHKEEWIGHEDCHIELLNSEIEGQLKIWSSSQSAIHFFVKEIEVGISSLPKSIPKQVVFVDTPGLFDPVAFRSQISIDYIHNANAVVVCVKAEDLHGEEVKTVESVFSFSGYKKEKVFIIATNWDKLNNAVVDWRKRYSYMVQSFTGKAFYPEKELAKKNILYASAYYYNLCRDYSDSGKIEKRKLNLFLSKLQMNIDECMENGGTVPPRLERVMDIEAGELTQKDLQALMNITNIQNINRVIINELVNQYSKLMYGDIKVLYEDIKHMVSRIAGERKKTIDGRIAISYEDVKKIEKKVEEIKKNKNKIQQYQNQLNAAMKSLDKSTQKRLDTIISKLV